MVAASKQTRLKMRKGFVAAPLTYKILMVRQFTDDDTKIITKGLIKALTPQKAKELLPTPSAPKSKWMIRAVSQVGSFDVQILMYKGLEVALFFKRQTSIITPEPEDPAPEGCIVDDDDIWVRMELFGKSPRQLVGSVAKELADKDLEISTLRLQLASKDRVEKHYKVEGLMETLRDSCLKVDAQAAEIKSLASQLVRLRAATQPKKKGSNNGKVKEKQKEGRKEARSKGKKGC